MKASFAVHIVNSRSLSLTLSDEMSKVLLTLSLSVLDADFGRSRVCALGLVWLNAHPPVNASLDAREFSPDARCPTRAGCARILARRTLPNVQVAREIGRLKFETLTRISRLIKVFTSIHYRSP